MWGHGLFHTVRCVKRVIKRVTGGRNPEVYLLKKKRTPIWGYAVFPPVCTWIY